MSGKGKKIAGMIAGMSGRYSPYEVLSDWVKACALCDLEGIQPKGEVPQWARRVNCCVSRN